MRPFLYQHSWSHCTQGFKCHLHADTQVTSPDMACPAQLQTHAPHGLPNSSPCFTGISNLACPQLTTNPAPQAHRQPSPLESAECCPSLQDPNPRPPWLCLFFHPTSNLPVNSVAYLIWSGTIPFLLPVLYKSHLAINI